MGIYIKWKVTGSGIMYNFVVKVLCNSGNVLLETPTLIPVAVDTIWGSKEYMDEEKNNYHGAK